MPQISVIIPCYNSQDTIEECAQSVLHQSFTDFELILIDDGSKDNTGLLCDKIKGNDHSNRTTVIHQKNAGRSATRHLGVERSKAPWCCFVDSDDKLSINALEVLSQRITEATDIIFGNGYSLPYPVNQQDTIDITTFRHLAVRAEGTIGVPWGSLYRRSLLTDYVFDLPREIYMGEDYIFWLRIIFSTDKPIAVVSESTYEKGEEHTSNSFVWTTNYAATIQKYRKESIPRSLYNEFLADTISDRKANLMACSMFQSRKEWQNSKFYLDLIHDMQQLGTSFTTKEKLFLSLPSKHLRKLYSSLSRKLR